MKLEATRLRFHYGCRALLENFSCTLSPGDFTMLIGPNGSGKSTVLKLLAGILQPLAGEVLLDGIPVANYPGRQRARKIAVVPQIPPPVLDFTVNELIDMGRCARLSRLTPPSRSDREAVARATRLLELDSLAARPCNRLSGGERQRVLIAAALVQEPEFLLLDEPTSALDPGHTLKLMRILQTLPNRPGVLMITHDLALAAKAAKQLILLKQGEIQATGTPDQVLSPENIREVYSCSSEQLHSKTGSLCIALEDATGI